MQKWLLAAGAFMIGATLGMGILAIFIVILVYTSVHHPQGAMALHSLKIGHGTVLVVPVVSGALAAWWALRRLSRIQG